MLTSIETDQITIALIEAQTEFPAIAFDADNPYFRSRYATLGAVISATKPILNKHKMVVLQTATSESEKVGVTTRLMHVSNQWFQDTIIIPLKGSSDKTQIAQVAGINISYLRRYSYAAILGLYAEEDTDGNIGGMDDGYEKPPKYVKGTKNKKAKLKPREDDGPHEDSLGSLMEEFGHLWSKARGLGNEEKDLPKLSKNATEQEVIEKMAELNIIMKESLGEEE